MARGTTVWMPQRLEIHRSLLRGRAVLALGMSQFGVACFDRVINDLVPRIRGLATGASTTLPFSVDPL